MSNRYFEADKYLKKIAKLKIFQLVIIQTNNIEKAINHLKTILHNCLIYNLSSNDFSVFYSFLEQNKGQNICVRGLDLKLNDELFLTKLNQARDKIAKLNVKLFLILFKDALKTKLANLLRDFLSYRHFIANYDFKVSELIWSEIKPPVERIKISKQEIERLEQEFFNFSSDNVNLFNSIAKQLLLGLLNSEQPDKIQNVVDKIIDFFNKTGEYQDLLEYAKTLLDYYYLDEAEKILNFLENKIAENFEFTLLKALTEEFKGNFQTALDLLFEAEKKAKKTNDKHTLAKIYQKIGEIYSKTGDCDKALEYFEKSKKIFEEIDDKSGLAAILDDISQIYVERGDYDKALMYNLISKSIYEEIYDLTGLATVLNNIGKIYDARGDYDTALKYYEKSKEILEQIGDLAGLGATLNNIASIYKARGDYDIALKYLEESKKIREQIGDIAELANSLNNIGLIYYTKGDYDKALKYFEESKKIYEQIGDLAGLGTTLKNIGQIYAARGDYDTALKYLEQSKEIFIIIENLATLSKILENIGQVYYARGNYSKALEYYENSKKIREQIGDIAGLANSLNNIGLIYYAKGDYDKAFEYFENSKKIFEQIGDLAGLGITLKNIGKIFYKKENYNKALEYFEKSKNVFEKLNYKNELAFTAFNLALVYLQLGKAEEFLKYLAQATFLAYELQNQELIQAVNEILQDLGIDREKLSKLVRAKYQKLIIQVQCDKCGNVFPVVVEVDAKSEGKVKEELSVQCPFCKTELIVELDYKIKPDTWFTKKFRGKIK